MIMMMMTMLMMISNNLAVSSKAAFAPQWEKNLNIIIVITIITIIVAKVALYIVRGFFFAFLFQPKISTWPDAKVRVAATRVSSNMIL